MTQSDLVGNNERSPEMVIRHASDAWSVPREPDEAQYRGKVTDV